MYLSYPRGSGNPMDLVLPWIRYSRGSGTPVDPVQSNRSFSHLLHLLVGSFGDGQFAGGVTRLHGHVRRTLSPVQHQHPLGQHSTFLIIIVLVFICNCISVEVTMTPLLVDDHFQSPDAFGILAPTLRRHEGPFDETIC